VPAPDTDCPAASGVSPRKPEARDPRKGGPRPVPGTCPPRDGLDL